MKAMDADNSDKEFQKWDGELNELITTLKNDLNNKDYIFHSESEGCTVSQLAIQDSPTWRWKGVMNVEFPAEKFLKCILASIELKARQVYDPDCCETKVIKESKFVPELKLFYSRYSTPTFVTNRDFIFVRKAVEEKDAFIFVAKSAIPSKKEENMLEGGYVRAELHMAAHYIEKLGDNKCKVTYITHANPGGW